MEATRRNPAPRLARALLSALFAGACASPNPGPSSGAAAPAAASGPIPASEPVVPVVANPSEETTARSEPEPPAACREPATPAPVRLSCDGTRIVSDVAIELHPARARPSAAVENALAEVAALLRRRPELLLVRIEVFARRPGKNAEERRRELSRAQERADALFLYLWRRRGISPERLEAVGYPFDAQRSKRTEPYPVVFVVVQRARGKK